MTDVNVLKIYNFVDSDNNQLQLRFGVLVDRDDLPSKDMGWRWSFVGTKIPMPVRCGTWFNGFPADTMLDWLKSNGWTVLTCVNLNSGRVVVYDTVKDEVSLNVLEERALNEALQLLVGIGHSSRACLLYRCIFGGSMVDATNAVKAICRKDG